uniref:LisH domain-containing protein n=1 Tax=Anopheles minimus TaxID=112268 RepID=A0A182W2J7_9DIPT
MDEDLEFRDMVLKKMEENGSLLDIKAKLRALLYDVIENEHAAPIDQVDDSNLTSSTVEKDPGAQLDAKTLVYELMLETLGSLNLQYTKKMLLAESGHRPMALNREQLAHQLKLDNSSNTLSGQPMLVSLVNKVRDENIVTETNYESRVHPDTITEDSQNSAQHLPHDL